MNASDDLFSRLTPEQLSALLQGGTLQDQGGLLAQQLQDLMGSGMQHQEHTTPLGAGLGGIAEALDGTANAFHAKALRGDQQKNLTAQQELMGRFGALLGGGSQSGAPANQPADPTQISSQWGMDLSQPTMAGAPANSQATPDRGMMLAPPPNQPADPTQVVDNGSEGWGLDLSDPAHVSAMIRGLKKQPEMLAAATSIHPNMPTRGPRLDDSESSPFGY